MIVNGGWCCVWSNVFLSSPCADDVLVGLLLRRVQEDLAIMMEGAYVPDHSTQAHRVVLLTDLISSPGSDGRYYLQAGAVCIAGKHTLVLLSVTAPNVVRRLVASARQNRFGARRNPPAERPAMYVSVAHRTSHDSPVQPAHHTLTDESKLHLSMSRFFKRLPFDKPVTRCNYSFQIVDGSGKGGTSADGVAQLLATEDNLDPTELAWAFTMGGDEDRADYERPSISASSLGNGNGKAAPNGHANGNGNAPGPRGQFGALSPNANPPPPASLTNLWLRTERQTLRRLPRTGAIAFTIRVYQTRVEELVREPGVPGRMASAVRSWPEDVARCAFWALFCGVLFVVFERALMFVAGTKSAARTRTSCASWTTRTHSNSRAGSPSPRTSVRNGIRFESGRLLVVGCE